MSARAGDAGPFITPEALRDLGKAHKVKLVYFLPQDREPATNYAAKISMLNVAAHYSAIRSFIPIANGRASCRNWSAPPKAKLSFPDFVTRGATNVSLKIEATGQQGAGRTAGAPFHEYKHWTHEGGISTPLIGLKHFHK